jgi:uncharacterized protein (DUF2164 family)
MATARIARLSEAGAPPFQRLNSPRINLMALELSKEARSQAITSIERYFRENMDEKIGNVTAGALLGFFLEEIGPTIYNKAVTDVQERLQARVAEIDVEVYESEFGYWSKFDKARKARPTQK